MQNRRFTILNLVILIPGFLAMDATAQRAQPSAYSGDLKVNYVRTWDAVKPETNTNNITVAALPTEFKMTSQYLDGLGRPIQTVLKQGSLVTGGSATDLVSAVTYDEYGREQYQYTPFVANNTGGNASINDGLFKLNPFQEQAVFMNQQYGAQGETWFYNRTQFEESPLNRINKILPVGNSWVGSDRGVTKGYSFNSSGETSIRIWTIADAQGSIPVDAGIYGDGELSRNQTFDEHNNLSFEYVDKEGKTIAKSSQVGSEWMLTFYVYDDRGQLRCVIPPKAILLIWSGWVISQTVMDELCFRYEYDKKGRMIVKKVPGAGEVYMVYDARDRLVLTQDANLRNGSPQQWMYTQYDQLNRPIASGLWTNSQTRSAHEAAAAGSINYPDLSGQSYVALTETYYDNYDWLAANGNPFSQNRNNWHDDHLLTPSSSFPYPQPVSQSFATNGLATGMKTRVLGTSQSLYSINYYDDKARVIQTISHNITGFTDVLTTQYDFMGKPLIQTLRSDKDFAVDRIEFIRTAFEYDDLGRLSNVKKTPYTFLDGNWKGGVQKQVSKNEYDALGQVKKKTLAPYYSSNGLETENFDYNIRGWLLGMNRDYTKNTNQSGFEDHYFGYELGYDKLATTAGQNFYNTPQYNGNILGTVWKSKGDAVRRKYDFTYDAANRFNWAEFTQNSNASSGGTFSSAEMNYSVHGFGPDNKIKYDLNGNIQEMVHRGWNLGTPAAWVDAMHYSYYDGTNKLKQVTDDNNDKDSKLGDFKYDQSTKTAIDYTYDVNGNLVSDQNKKISSIIYNHLNLPQQITVDGKGTITYTYDAAGNKLRKTTVENGATVVYQGTSYTSTITSVTNYFGGTIYENKTYTGVPSALNQPDQLQFIGMEEGRIRFRSSDNSFQYDYMLKDHLGNVRAVLTDEQKTDMYPAATMESANATTEEALYSNLSNTRTNAPIGYGGGTPQEVSRVKAAAGSQKIGPAIVLKVMAGDKFNLSVNSWWKSLATPGTPVNPFDDLLGALIGSVGGVTSTHGGATALQLQNGNLLNGAANDFLNSRSYDNTKPKAYISWVLLDEQFKFVASNSGVEQVPGNNTYTTHTRTDMPIDKNGYLYIYVSNETPNIDVFFDNLQVTHIRGPILEETHYYPFGLTMAGISSKALVFGEPGNKMKFQGQEFASKEFSDGSGLDMYEFKWRMHDPQIGRFWQTDPLSDKYVHNSTYAFSENKVTNHIELEGLEAIKAGIVAVANPQHHQKTINTIRLPRDQTLNSSSTHYQTNKSVEGLASEIVKLNFTTSITERIGTSTSTIENWGNLGNFLVSTTNTKTTVVTFDLGNIESITETTSKNTSISRVISDDEKNNEIELSLLANDNSSGAPEISIKKIPVAKSLTDNIKKMSSVMGDKVIEAVYGNKYNHVKTGESLDKATQDIPKLWEN